MLNHIDLSLYYQTVFGMIQHHKYSLTEIENMIPYEFDIYVHLLVDFIKNQENKK
jgi:hypothetical protein